MSRKEKARGIVTCESDGACETYSNHVVVFFRSDDLRIAFGQYIASGGDPFAKERGVQIQEVKNSVEPRAGVTVSWAVAKLLHEMLGSGIKKFEELNGEIKQNAAPFAPSA